MLVLEFTIEPFIEGNPGPHVLSAVQAATSLGIAVEFGPFGSTCTVPVARIGEVTSAITVAAFANGATHVTLHAERLDDGKPGNGTHGNGTPSNATPGDGTPGDGSGHGSGTGGPAGSAP